MNIKEKIERLEKELQELKEQVANQEQAKNKTPIGWVPGDGENYYFVDYDGSINSETNNSTYDDSLIKHCKVFQTEEEAEFYAEKLKVERELEKFAGEFMYDKKNWTIVWEYNEGKIYYAFTTCMKRNSIYFESEEKAQEAVQAVGEDRIKKYYLEVEDEI